MCEVSVKMVDALELSHTGGGYFELSKDNEKTFNQFSNWLRFLNVKLHFTWPSLFIDNFNITSDDVRRAYSNRSPHS
jgi:hypothetical protein